MEAAWREDEGSSQSPEGEEEEEEEEEEEGHWEYDSTWEEEEEEAAPDPGGAQHPKPPQPHLSSRWAQEQKRPHFSFGFGIYKSTNERNWMAAKDMQRYRRHYPGLEETDTEASEEEMWNLSFYKNEIPFKPRGLFIDELLDTWQNDYETMEKNHTYIQWLFPLREQGMNMHARLLTCREIQAFKKSKEVMDRFIQVYKLMLRFYGIDLINEETGELRRAENWRERFHNLNLRSHNNLRITRILKCLGEFGYEHYQVHLVKFFLAESLIYHTLPQVQKSALDYFMFTVRNKQKRRELIHFAWQHFERSREFVWGPHKKLLKFKPRSPEFLSELEFVEQPESAREGSGDAEGEVKHVSEPEASEKMKEPSSASATKEEAKDKQCAPVLFLASESEALVGESESSTGGADGESLKESKKRKLEMNKLSKERAASSKSPTDIESISCNLEEVVIDKGSNCHAEAEETSEPFAPEGGDTKGVKDAGSANAMVKRRKVDELVSKDTLERTGKTGAEDPSFQGHVTNCTVSSIESTDQEKEKAVDISAEAPADCTTAVNTRNTTEPEPPSDVLEPAKVDGQGTTSTLDREGLQPCEGLPAPEKEEDHGTGQVEGGEDATGERKRLTQKPDVKELHSKQDLVI